MPVTVPNLIIQSNG